MDGIDAFKGLANIARKKCEIMAELQRLQKDSRNKAQNYDYTSASVVSDTVRPMLAEKGLALFSSMSEWQQAEFETKSGGKGYKTKVRFEFTWIDTETGVSHVDSWWMEADDYQDKSFSKASTLAMKYYLLNTFVLSTGDPADDPDSGVQVESKQQRKQPQQQSRAPQSSGNRADMEKRTGGASKRPTFGENPDMLAKMQKFAKDAGLDDFALLEALDIASLDELKTLPCDEPGRAAIKAKIAAYNPLDTHFPRGA